MAVSRARSVERSRWGWLLSRLPAGFGSGFRTTCQPAGASPWRGSKEARAPARSSGIRRARHGSPRSGRGGHAMAAVMIGVDPHKASHTAVVINAAEEPLGGVRVRASVIQVERLL